MRECASSLLKNSVDIQREFDKAFKELFGGGKGTLELVEDEDILEAGIRIISQPPGKKLQNMMQLSGGEKALDGNCPAFCNPEPETVAVLSSWMRSRQLWMIPMSASFANYLHKLTKNTQFIIITHRRGTMTCSRPSVWYHHAGKRCFHPCIGKSDRR